MTKTNMTIGAHLARLRRAAGLTQRQVEKASGKEVSGPYLCQLENNDFTNPSPRVLRALARVYNTPYEDLMRRAGLLPAKPTDLSRGRGRFVPFSIQGLTPEEERILIEFLAIIRRRKQK